MKALAVILELHLLFVTIVCSQNKCSSIDSANPFHGLGCPTKGIIKPNLSWHQCKLFCLNTTSCQAFNYNFVDNLCEYFTVSCTKAISHQDMAYVLFTERQPQQCIGWVQRENGDPADDARSVTEDNVRFVARLQKGGNDWVGYVIGYPMLTCLAHDDEGRISTTHGLPCQYLRVREGCTVYYVDYELGAPLPRTAVIAGYTAEGLPVYVGITDGRTRPGHYTTGSNALITTFGNVTENIKLLIAI